MKSALQRSQNLMSLVESSASDSEHFIILRLGEKYLGVALENITEIVRAVALDSIPESTASTLGVLNYRGLVLAVVDLWKLLGLPTLPLHPDMVMIILSDSGSTYGIVVEEVLGVGSLVMEERPDELRSDVIWPLVKGVAYLHDLRKFVLIVNPDRLRIASTIDEKEGGEEDQ